jgi:hypothetical protein
MSDDPALQSAIVLYSTLKAHKFMAELIERRFERHPVMAPTFNGFIFSERASHGDIPVSRSSWEKSTTLLGTFNLRSTKRVENP